MINLTQIKEKIKNKHCYILILAIVVILLLVFSIKHFNNTNQYILQPVERRTITQVVEASGTINPVNTVSVGSTVSGLVSAIYVDFNSMVKKGQLLAEIDPRTFQQTVNQNLASVNSARANLRDMQANAEMSKKTLVRYQNLYKRNFVPKSELDQALSDYKSDIARVSAAQAEIARANAQYQNSLVNLNYTKIVAPVDGMIISREIDLGQPVAASFQAPQLFTIAQDLQKMQIEVNVSEADIGKVQEGQEVEYTLDGYPNVTFNGKVTQVRISPTTVSNVVTYSVIVGVDNQDLKLKPGMTANVSIITAKHEDVLCVPNFALKFTPDMNGPKYENQGIWLLVKKVLKRFDIETGLSDDSYTEIISSNIKEGDMVVIGQNGKKDKKKSSNMRMRPPMM
ncbi:MAG: efflux RND transporter periplasmic adaptor subunit [Candidatus Gastranaerophilales bacterium]|nr:efflux RND transporter periplasmic adaptor subunit [Candidatus Gastranaerophilales bacterium]